VRGGVCGSCMDTVLAELIAAPRSTPSMQWLDSRFNGIDTSSNAEFGAILRRRHLCRARTCAATALAMTALPHPSLISHHSRHSRAGSEDHGTLHGTNNAPLNPAQPESII
jgi:hypothetical protein